jgi:succinate dehydrogenase/fumarate reductase flavoprotein subunit
LYYIEETDIVIAGGGAAGAMAAIYARRANPKLRVALLDKSKLETSGAAGRGMDGLNNVAIPPASEPEDLVAFLTKITEGVLDQGAAYEFAKRCPQVVSDLEGILNRKKGDLFPVDENGNYRLIDMHGIGKPFLLPMDGEEMKRALAGAVRASGTVVYDRTPAIKIVVAGGRVAGVLGFNIRTGAYHFLKTKAVCLTAGCAGRMGLGGTGFLAGTYEFPGCSGDGYAMAYDAGAELVNMECFQVSAKLKDHMGPMCGFVAGPRGAHTVNRLGEKAWTHPYSSGDSRLGVWKAFAEGKGPMYMNMDHLPEETIKVIEKIQFGTERTSRALFHKNRGQDYRDPKTVEVEFSDDIGVCGGHGSSGVLSDYNGATRVPGLYVAGDVDGGVPHTMLGGALAMGGLIGTRAAEYAANTGYAGIDGPRSLVRREIDLFESPLRRDRGLPTNLVETKARSRILYYLKPPKNSDYLTHAIWWMDRIEHEDLPRIRAVDFHDLLKVHEIRSILLVGRMMAQASLFREESRWGYFHWRVDIPRKKPEWDQTWVVLRKGESGIDCSKRKVPPPKWKFQDYMAYEYPNLCFDVGMPAASVPPRRLEDGDPWTLKHIEKDGMGTPRRFMPDRKG